MTKKPAPAPIRPQSAPVKKPVPAAPRPQNSAVAKTSSTVTKAPSQATKQAQEAPKAGNWISRTVQAQVQKVGDYAGGYVLGIGDSVNKVGENLGSKYVFK